MGKWSPCSLQEINRDKIRGSFSPFMNSAGYLVEQQIKRDDIDVHVQKKKKEKKGRLLLISFSTSIVYKKHNFPQHSPHVSYISLSRRRRLGNGNDCERLGLFSL